jgi:hypothetical protein
MTRITLLALTTLTLAYSLSAEETITGQWMIDQHTDQGAVAGKVQLTLHRSSVNSQMTSSSALPLEQLRGLSPQQMQSPAGATVHFEIAREAGTLACDGYFRSNNGAGAFTFSPNANFVSQMRSLGYNSLAVETVFSMAVHDVKTAYVRDLRALGVAPNSSDELISMSIHNVTIDYVRDLKNLGLHELTADHLVSMRIHDVSVEFVRDLKGMGYAPSADDMVSLRIHGATSEYVKQVKNLGFNPTLDQLVSMRIHGVTPDYIQKVQAHGVKNLTVDQLVNLRIHGIIE